MYENEKIAHITKEEVHTYINKRAKKILNKIIKENKNQDILVITHNSFINSSIRSLFNIREVFKNFISGEKHCHITIIKIEGNKKNLIMSKNNFHLLK